MNSKAQAVAGHFAALIDPRVKRTRLHKLIDIVVVSIAGVIAGADSRYDIERYGLSKEPWLRQFLELPSGIPSQDTFARVFVRLDPAMFQACFLSWMAAVSEVMKGLVPIDGKTLRGSSVVGSSPLRRMALTLLKQAPTKNASIRGRRLEAGWNDDYMRRVLIGRGAPPTAQGLQEQSR